MNPHCSPDKFAEFNPILFHGLGERMTYTPRQLNERRLTVHRGQRKLLFSEIGALLKTDPQKNYTAVYAGAAPGIHTPFLSDLFPNVTFHLYDPAPFQIRESPRIRIFNAYFTDEVAMNYAATSDLIFICDIRRTVEEENVWEDMLAQQRWYEIMHPVITSLKFRLPWPGKSVLQNNPDNTVEYLDGEIHLPIWGRHSTTETRLVIMGPSVTKRSYDCKVYEEEMSFFNRVVRPSIHPHPPVRGLDACFDCTAEVNLLAQYCLRTHGSVAAVADLSDRVTRVLGRGV